jgi:hypothetical protein
MTKGGKAFERDDRGFQLSVILGTSPPTPRPSRRGEKREPLLVDGEENMESHPLPLSVDGEENMEPHPQPLDLHGEGRILNPSSLMERRIWNLTPSPSTFTERGEEGTPPR